MGSCPRCGGETTTVAVPERYRALLPADPSRVTICRRCLTLRPSEAAAEDDLSLDTDALPADRPATVGVLLLVALCESLALNRRAIQTLVERLEADGVDPLLVLDRLAEDPALEPAVDLSARRRQLEQVLE